MQSKAFFNFICYSKHDMYQNDCNYDMDNHPPDTESDFTYMHVALFVCLVYIITQTLPIN